MQQPLPIGDATADLYPRVTLGAGASSTGATEDLLTTPTNRFGTGLAIHWQANQSLARVRIAQASAAEKLVLALGGGSE